MKKLYFNPKDGNFNFENPSMCKDLIKRLPEKRHVMEIKKYSGKRSLGANAYYFAVVVPYFMSEMGLVVSESNKEYVHYDILGQELRQIPDPNRPGKTMTQRTRDMDGSTFWKYIYKCEGFFHEWFNGSFPPPRQIGYDTTKR